MSARYSKTSSRGLSTMIETATGSMARDSMRARRGEPVARDEGRRSGRARHEPHGVPVLARQHGLGALGVAPATHAAELADDGPAVEAVHTLPLERRAVT